MVQTTYHINSDLRALDAPEQIDGILVPLEVMKSICKPSTVIFLRRNLNKRILHRRSSCGLGLTSIPSKIYGKIMEPWRESLTAPQNNGEYKPADLPRHSSTEHRHFACVVEQPLPILEVAVPPRKIRRPVLSLANRFDGYPVHPVLVKVSFVSSPPKMTLTTNLWKRWSFSTSV
jgi:hypothetical protein